MLFLKPAVTKKNREFFFSLFVLLDLLFTASNLIFDLGLNKSNLEGFVWSHQSTTGLISQWQVGLLDVALFKIS